MQLTNKSAQAAPDDVPGGCRGDKQSCDATRAQTQKPGQNTQENPIRGMASPAAA